MGYFCKPRLNIAEYTIIIATVQRAQNPKPSTHDLECMVSHSCTNKAIDEAIIVQIIIKLIVFIVINCLYKDTQWM